MVLIFGKNKQKKSKFNNKKNIYQNIKFDSILERDCYKIIKKQCLLRKLGLSLQVPYQITSKHKYIADFVVKCPNTNKSLIIDAKGFKTDIFKLKSELMLIKYQKVHCVSTPCEAYKLIDNFF